LAGALAVQEGGMVLVKGIQGCFFNVMGFPMSRFYQELRLFLSDE
jgi:septum formation protein